MKIMFVGDINLGEYYTSFGHGPGSFAANNYAFSKVQKIFESAHLVVGNLEASITDFDINTSDPEKMVLKVSPEVAHQLKKARFGVLQVANNHSIQHGLPAFDQSLALISKMGIKSVGLAGEELVVEKYEDMTVGFMAASDVPDNTFKDQDSYQRLDDSFFAVVESSLQKVDHLIVMLHWGLEASTEPLRYQRVVAEKLKRMGVRAIVGSHPHLFYEIEAEQDFVCAYSLGNFVFDMCWESRLTKSGILELELTNRSCSAKVWPVELKNNGSVPTPTTSEALDVVRKLTLYDNGTEIRWQQPKKIIYTMVNIFRGNTYLKIIFLMKKLKMTWPGRV